MRAVNPFCFVLLGLLLAGCAKYEYNIVHPPDLSAHIGRNADHVVTLPPLEYRLRSYDNRLVMRIYNQAQEPIMLLGDRSIAISPDRQSHPLRSQTIATGSYIKLIFPPVRPRVYYPGPTWGVGVGTTVYHHHHDHHPHYHYNDPTAADDPQYLDIYDEADETLYWDWEGQGEASFTLVYRHGDKDLKHEFTFRRQKM